MRPAVPAGGAPGPYGVRCAVFTVDIAGFGDLRREDPVRVSMRAAMYEKLADAFEFAGVPWAAVEHEDRGDGVLVIVPGGVPDAILINPLLARLLSGLHAYNGTATEIARIRLRAALHAGHVYRDAEGLVGETVNTAFRLLDAAELKKTLAATGAELAFITSDLLYDQVVRHRQAGIDPDTFHQVTVAEKETTGRAWIHLPGRGPARAWAAAVATAPRPAPGPAHGGFQGFVFNGETHIEGDAVAGDKHVVAPGDTPGPPSVPPGQAAPPAAPPADDRPELDPGPGDDRP